MDTFNKGRGNKVTTAYSAYGHTHEQKCERTDKNGACDSILTGGGGGCCSSDTLRGFFVIGFDKDKNMIQPLKIDDSQISCKYPCSADITEEEMIQSNFFHCCHTSHGQDCELYDLSKC